jgi:hypothetical protein
MTACGKFCDVCHGCRDHREGPSVSNPAPPACNKFAEHLRMAVAQRSLATSIISRAGMSGLWQPQLFTVITPLGREFCRSESTPSPAVTCQATHQYWTLAVLLCCRCQCHPDIGWCRTAVSFTQLLRGGLFDNVACQRAARERAAMS